MSTDQDRVRTVISEFLQRAEKPVDSFSEDTGLWGGGLEFDSLEAAELSAMLEDEFGSDPFSVEGAMPENVGDILRFYNGAPTLSPGDTVAVPAGGSSWSGDPR